MILFRTPAIEYIEQDGIVFQIDKNNPFRRFDPVTLLVVGIGAAMQAKATLDEGKAGVKYAKIQQQQYVQEAAANRNVGNYESREKRKEGYRLKASQIAQIGAQGGSLSGTNLAMITDSAREVESDAFLLQRNYDLKSDTLINKGKFGVYSARVARRASRIKAFTNAVESGERAAMMGA